MRCAAYLSLLLQALRVWRELRPLKRGTPAGCGALVWVGQALVLAAGAAWGGGPVGITPDARPLRWDSSQAVRYQVDLGGLGSRGSETATGMVQRAFQTWGEVPTARLRMEFAGRLAQDITGRNAAAFLDNLPLNAPGVVLFDHDGSIVDLLFGYGASDGLLGFAEPYEDPRQPGRIVQSVAVINGPLHEEFRDPYLLSTIVHEMGSSPSNLPVIFNPCSISTSTTS